MSLYHQVPVWNSEINKMTSDPLHVPRPISLTCLPSCTMHYICMYGGWSLLFCWMWLTTCVIPAIRTDWLTVLPYSVSCASARGVSQSSPIAPMHRDSTVRFPAREVYLLVQWHRSLFELQQQRIELAPLSLLWPAAESGLANELTITIVYYTFIALPDLVSTLFHRLTPVKFRHRTSSRLIAKNNGSSWLICSWLTTSSMFCLSPASGRRFPKSSRME